MADTVTCPNCKTDQPGEPVKFTLWGGMLGPRILHHVKCPKCGARYNGKTGKSNTTAITLYVAVPLLIALVVALLVLKRVI
ncbi:MAG: hypothetical protein U1F43_08795 [Myxococcota bacterium]